jgi:hypothetical protein
MMGLSVPMEKSVQVKVTANISQEFWMTHAEHVVKTGVRICVQLRGVEMVCCKATKNVMTKIQITTMVVLVHVPENHVETAFCKLTKSVMMEMQLMVMDVILYVRTNPNALDQTVNAKGQIANAQDQNVNVILRQNRANVPEMIAVLDLPANVQDQIANALDRSVSTQSATNPSVLLS